MFSLMLGGIDRLVTAGDGPSFGLSPGFSRIVRAPLLGLICGGSPPCLIAAKVGLNPSVERITFAERGKGS